MVLQKHLKVQQFDQRGWIPGPKEEEKPFLKRVETLDHFFSYPPEDVDHFLTDRDWEPACKSVEILYDFSPDWIVAHYSNRHLPFFQGAATWISQKGGIRIPLIQLKEKFETGRLFWLYKRDEVLAHEAVHAARMEFDEPHFEEIFAYRTSPNRVRRFFGPLFEKPWESYLFLALLFFPLGIEFLAFFGIESSILNYLRWLPLGFLGILLIRLTFFQVTLCIALKKIAKWLEHPSKKWAVALRLTDREIFSFAYRKAQALILHIENEKSLRWQLLKQKYFKKKLGID